MNGAAVRGPVAGLPAVAGLALTIAGCSLGSDGTSSAGFQDCTDCPRMVTVPAGEFAMGSPEAETVRPGWPPKAGGNERPVHTVKIAAPFAIGTTEVTVAEFAAFVADTGLKVTPGCIDLRGGTKPVEDPSLSWQNPGFEQSPSGPVTCVSWNDATAYTTWLSRRTGHHYRLPSEAEWEYAARAGSTTPYFWGEDATSACRFANTRTAPEQIRRGLAASEDNFPCDDGAERPADAGSYAPNAFGLHDTVGNVFEWTEDCNHPSYDGAPTDGTAWLDPTACVFRVMRGGSASNGPRQNRAAARGGRPVTGRAPNLGFRVARDLGADTRAGNQAEIAAPTQSAVLADGSPEAALFAARCAGCHVDRATFRGAYGRDQASVEKTIREGGANTMSMPAWGNELGGDEIRSLAAYVRRVAGWN